MFIKVEEIVAYFVMMCDDDDYVAAAKSVTYTEGPRATIAFFFWRLGRVTS